MFLVGCGFLMIVFVFLMLLRMLGLMFYGVGIFSYYGFYWVLFFVLLLLLGLVISIVFINLCLSFGGFLINKLLGFVFIYYGVIGIFIVEVIFCFVVVVVLVLMKIDVKKEKS